MLGPEQLLVLDGQRLEQTAVPFGLGPGLLNRESLAGRHPLAVDATPEIQGPRLAVRHHLVVEFDDQTVEMDDIPLNGILLLEDDFRFIVTGCLNETDRSQHLTVLVALGDHLGIADLVLVGQIGNRLLELLVLGEQLVNRHRPAIDAPDR